MEQTVKKNASSYLHYFVLAAMLILTIVGIVLILAHGLDRDRFFVTLDIDQCVLPFAFCFFIYMAIEDLALFALPSYGKSLLPFAKNDGKLAAKVSSIVTVVSLIAAIIALFVARGDMQFTKAASFLSIGIVPGMATYLVMHMIPYFKEGDYGKGLWILFGYLMALIAFETATLIGILSFGPEFSLFYVGMPLLCICFAMLGRKEDL